MDNAHIQDRPHNLLAAFFWASAIGTLGGLIGLGGAEFRLPVLIEVFAFAPLPAVILNKALSLVVVATALPFRTATIPFSDVLNNWPTIANLLGGSLLGAYCGASWATRLSSRMLYRIIAVLLVVIAIVLVIGHDVGSAHVQLQPSNKLIAGLVAGFIIGVVASLLGVAGGELLIPTLVILFGADIKLAGSLSLAVSLPTMLVGFARYSRDGSFDVLKSNLLLFWIMVAGSIVGTFVGGRLLGMVPSEVLLPLLAVILLISSWRMWQHK